MVQFNGEYGCMGDLGMHVCHVPFRAGWIPRNVRAVLSNIVTERPDGRGGPAPCETWDNATLLCDAADPARRRSVSDDAQDAADRARRDETPGTWKSWARGPRRASRRRIPNGWKCSSYSGGEQVWGRDRHGPRDGLQEPSPAQSSSSAFPTRFCRCGPPSCTNWSTAGRRARSPVASRRRKPP